jgi:hypothetical protein
MSRYKVYDLIAWPLFTFILVSGVLHLPYTAGNLYRPVCLFLICLFLVFRVIQLVREKDKAQKGILISKD